MVRTTSPEMEYKEHVSDSVAERLIIESRSTKGFKMVPRQWYKIFGLVEANVLAFYVEQHIYFKDKYPTKKGWFYLIHQRIADELNTTEYLVRNAKNLLLEMNIIQVKKEGLPAKEMILINWNELLKLQYSNIGLDILNLGGQENTDLVGQENTDLVGHNKSILNKKEESKSLDFSNEKSFLVDSGKITKSLFDEFWNSYPKKSSKGQVITTWNKLCSKPIKERPDWKVIKKALHLQKKTKQWIANIIPNASTWLNESRWLDDPEQMTWTGTKESKGPKLRNTSLSKVPIKYDSGKTI